MTLPDNHPWRLLRDDVRAFIDRPKRLFIGGTWREPVNGRSLEVLDPALGTRVCEVPAGDAKDVDLAVIAAREAFARGP